MAPLQTQRCSGGQKHAVAATAISRIAPCCPISRLQRVRAIVTAAPPAAAAAASVALPSSPSKSLQRSVPGVFLSREECLHLLNRVADGFITQQAGPSTNSSSHPDALAYVSQNDDDSGSEASLISQVLDVLYDEMEEVFISKRGYLIPSREAALVESTGGSPTYGEITSEGIRQFLQRVPLQSDDVLVDLGSGLGRLTLQVACCARLRRCVGLELSASRHQQASWLAGQLAELGGLAAAAGAGAEGEEEDAEEAGEEGRQRAAAITSAGTRGAAGEATGTTSRSTGNSSSSSSSAVLAHAPPFAVQPHAVSQGQQHRSIAPHDQEVSSGDQDSELQSSPERPQSPQSPQELQQHQQQQLLLSPVELRCEDILTADLQDGTAFFLCSTAFSAAACRAIAERLVRHPPFRLLVTSRALPFPSPLTQLGQFPCNFSWTPAGTAYVYVRSLQQAPPALLAAFLSQQLPFPPRYCDGMGDSSDSHGKGDGYGGRVGITGSSSSGGVAAGGIAWLPSTSLLSVVPADLMV